MSKKIESVSANNFSGLPKNALVLLAERCVWWTQQFTKKDLRSLKSIAERPARIKKALHVDGKNAYESFSHPNDKLYSAEELSHLVDTALLNIYDHVYAEYIKFNADEHHELVYREELGYYPSLNEKAGYSANEAKSTALDEIRQDLELLKIVAKIEKWDDNHPIPKGFFDKYSNLLTTYEPIPGDLVQVKQSIDAEMIKFLKKHPKFLYQLKPRQFEELVGEILSSYGWTISITPATKDGGYDLFAIVKDRAGVSTSWIIECKKNAPNRKVGVDVVRGLWGVKQDLRVANALLATTSYFTKGVNDFKASRYDLELKDLEGILEWLNEYKPRLDGKLYIRDNKLILPSNNSKLNKYSS